MSTGNLQLPLEQSNWNLSIDQLFSRYYIFHLQPEHMIESYFQFRDFIYDLHEGQRIDWAKMHKVITEIKERIRQQSTTIVAYTRFGGSSESDV